MICSFDTLAISPGSPNCPLRANLPPLKDALCFWPNVHICTPGSQAASSGKAWRSKPWGLPTRRHPTCDCADPLSGWRGFFSRKASSAWLTQRQSVGVLVALGEICSEFFMKTCFDLISDATAASSLRPAGPTLHREMKTPEIHGIVMGGGRRVNY